MERLTKRNVCDPYRRGPGNVQEGDGPLKKCYRRPEQGVEEV